MSRVSSTVPDRGPKNRITFSPTFAGPTFGWRTGTLAVAHGFDASFELAGFIAVLGFAAAMAAVRRPRPQEIVQVVEAKAA
jgi:hypothetical protein